MTTTMAVDIFYSLNLSTLSAILSFNCSLLLCRIFKHLPLRQHQHKGEQGSEDIGNRA